MCGYAHTDRQPEERLYQQQQQQQQERRMKMKKKGEEEKGGKDTTILQSEDVRIEQGEEGEEDEVKACKLSRRASIGSSRYLNLSSSSSSIQKKGQPLLLLLLRACSLRNSRKSLGIPSPTSYI